MPKPARAVRPIFSEGGLDPGTGWTTCSDCGGLVKPRCSTCFGVGWIPLVPPIGEVVVYRLPLDRFELDMISDGSETTESLVPRLHPLLVVRSDRCASGSTPWVARVSGWMFHFGDPRSIRGALEHAARDERATFVPGLGWVVPVTQLPPMVYLEDVEGPSDEPGHWRWKEAAR